MGISLSGFKTYFIVTAIKTVQYLWKNRYINNRTQILIDPYNYTTIFFFTKLQKQFNREKAFQQMVVESNWTSIDRRINFNQSFTSVKIQNI